jgi:hypothetical protein
MTRARKLRSTTCNVTRRRRQRKPHATVRVTAFGRHALRDARRRSCSRHPGHFDFVFVTTTSNRARPSALVYSYVSELPSNQRQAPRRSTNELVTALKRLGASAGSMATQRRRLGAPNAVAVADFRRLGADLTVPSTSSKAPGRLRMVRAVRLERLGARRG